MLPVWERSIVIEAGSPAFRTKTATIRVRSIAHLLDCHGPPHPRVELLNVSIIDPHARVDFATVVPDPVPWTSGSVGQFPQCARTEAAVDSDHTRKQFSCRLGERVAHHLLLPIPGIRVPCTTPDGPRAEPFEFPIKILEYRTVLPGLETLSDERLPKLDERPNMAKIDDLLESEVAHRHALGIALVQYEIRHSSAVVGHRRHRSIYVLMPDLRV